MSIAGQGKGAVRAILYALGANAGIAVAKGGAAFWTGSGAMLADTLHSMPTARTRVCCCAGCNAGSAAPPQTIPSAMGVPPVSGR